MVIRIDDEPRAEYSGADDSASTGVEALKEPYLNVIKVGDNQCRYPDATVCDRFAVLDVVGAPTRVTGRWAHGARVVVANMANHQAVVVLVGLCMHDRQSAQPSKITGLDRS